MMNSSKEIMLKYYIPRTRTLKKKLKIRATPQFPSSRSYLNKKYKMESLIVALTLYRPQAARETSSLIATLIIGCLRKTFEMVRPIVLLVLHCLQGPMVRQNRKLPATWAVRGTALCQRHMIWNQGLPHINWQSVSRKQTKV